MSDRAAEQLGSTGPLEATEPLDSTGPIARELSRRGLAAPALLMLEAHRPIRPLLAVGATFLLPIARPLLGATAARWARAVHDDVTYDALLGHLRREAKG